MKLLVSDYDNTYELHYENLELDLDKIFSDNKNAISKFRKNGNIFCLSTGRSFEKIKQTITEKNIVFDYLATNNGAELYDSNYKLLYYVELKNDILVKLKQLEKYVKIYYRKAYSKNCIISANIYFDDLEKYNFISNFIKENFDNCIIEYKFPKIKILNGLSDKNDIIEIVKNKENILDQDIYTIGDDLNDLRMLKTYNGYTLETSKEEMKKEISNIVDNLSDLIEKIL